MIQVQARTSGSGVTHKALAYQILRALAVVLLVTLAVAPFANVVAIIAGTGADNLSNDYLGYTGLIGQVLAGSYDWSHYFRDTFYRTHSVALPVLLHIADARFFHWSIYPELYSGIAIAAVRLVFLYQTFSRTAGSRAKWLLWPTLSLLVFSVSQISVYAFGDGSLTIGLSLLGFALAIWGLVCGRHTAAALLAMFAGGLIASFSWGNGLVSWLIFLVALPLLGYRKPWHYAVWLFGFSLSVLPYLLFLPIPGLSHAPVGGAGQTVVSLFNWRFVISSLGWPFSNNIGSHVENVPEAGAIGCIGLGLASVGITLIARLGDRGLWQKSAPALLLIAHGLLSLWQISVFRSLIAPWYTAVSMSFWIGLCALAITVLQERSHGQRVSPVLMRVSRVWAGMVLVFVAGAYLRSNLSYEDKTEFLFSRSPASASALRNYRCAPTYGEGLLFQWGIGNPGLLELLARPLEQHQLSVFAPRQEWTLQGDYLLDRVKVIEQPNVPDVIWTTGTGTAGRLPWYHYKHLNLLLAAPNVVTWTVDLPPDLQSADFLSATTLSESAPKAAGTAWCKVDIRSEHGKPLLSFAKPVPANNHAWQPLKIDLAPYKGQRIMIRLSVWNGRNKEAGWLVYRYPRIELIRSAAESGDNAPKLELRPSNTDLSPEFTPTSADDFVELNKLGTTALDLALSQYSHLWAKVAVPPSVKPRLLTFTLTVSGKPAPVPIQIPLLPDGTAHSYTYDLKLLDLDQSTRLTSVSVEPPTAGGNEPVRISELRFIRKQP